MKLLTLQLHEYSHHDDDYESHEHSSAFYQKFHDIMLYDMDRVAALALKMDNALSKLKPAMESRIVRKAKATQPTRKATAVDAPSSSARGVSTEAQGTADDVQHAEFIRRQIPLFEQSHC